MRRTIVASALLLALSYPAGAHARRDGCRTQACIERVAARFCAGGRVTSCIHRGALRWRVDYRMLRRKAVCESGLSPRAYNPSGAMGLFQFMGSTWASTPYAAHSVWSAKWASLGAGWMHAVGRGGEWACA